jgi:hypothetical protein
MYRPEIITQNLLHLLGWRQNYNTADFAIADTLTQSESGQYFQDIHPLLTLDNVKAIAPDFESISLSAWVEATQYRKGDRRSDNNVDYRAKVDNIGKVPETSPNEWELFDPFNEWLENKTKASILNAVQTFFSDKMIETTAKSILENKILFDGSGRLTDLVPNLNRLVGFEITPIRSKGITLKIERIGTQFTGTGEMKLYLFHSSSSEPVKEITITRTKDGAMEWSLQNDLILPYVSDSIDAGGSWFLCYDQREIGAMQAIFKSRDWSKTPCDTCNREEHQSWSIWSKYLEVHPFRTTVENPGDMLEIDKNVYTYDSNYGLNLQITMECDLTDIITEQRKAFQNVIGLQVASDFIREMAYNPQYRINRTQQNFTRMELLYELDGDSQSPKKSGINYKLNRAMQALKMDTTGINRVCMPCKSEGLRYRTI